MAQTQPQSVWVDYSRDIPQADLVKLIRPQEKANHWFLMGVLGISTINVSDVNERGNRRYQCHDFNGGLIVDIELPNDMPLKEKVVVIRTAVRMSTHGHHH